MNQKSLEQILKLVEENWGNDIEVIEYCGKMNDKSELKCNICGNIWFGNLTSVTSKKNKRGCPKCGIKRQVLKRTLKYEDVKKYIESFGCKLLSEEYVNTREKLKILYPCGHIWETIYDNFKSGTRCGFCYHETCASKIRRTEDKIIKKIESRNLTFIRFEGEYKNGLSKVTYSCNGCGKEITWDVEQIFYGNIVCWDCYLKDLARERSGPGGSNWQGGISSLRSYLWKNIAGWKRLSSKLGDYTCVATGKKMECVHHLVSFSNILKEALKNCRISASPTTKLLELSEKEVSDLTVEFVRLHEFYGPGVPLTTKAHRIFHSLYGRDGKTTPAQFEEFLSRINSGEITLES